MNVPAPSPLDRAVGRLAAARTRLREQHLCGGTPAVQICNAWTDVMDVVVHDLYVVALREVDSRVASQVALVAHGGYGRRDAAPYSDVDLMLLYAPAVRSKVQPLASKLSQQIFDTKLQLGFTSRTPGDACRFALQDAITFTSLAESRLVDGSVRLFRRFFESLRRAAHRRSHRLIVAIEQARAEEKIKYGDTEFLLCPNVKRSQGTLRDLQLVRWIGFARYGETELENLERMGALLPEDRRAMQSALEYLLRLRNELHFHAQTPQDVFTKAEQLRLAEQQQLSGPEGVLPVEILMRDYFEHTSEVRYRTAHFVADARQRSTVVSLLENTLSRRVNRDLRMSWKHIGAVNQTVLDRLSGDLTAVLDLMALASQNNKRIDHLTWTAIRTAMKRDPPTLTPLAAAKFLDLLSKPPRLAQLLRRLHQLRVLERIVPPVEHARCLLQFNEYHKYTVDEHSLRAVKFATRLLHEPGPLGDAYRGIRDKRLLHLALLMHDLGKGYTEDHSIVGARLARETSVLLGLDEAETETVVHLVEHHLKMAHLAFRHDLSDESVIVRFAADVGRVDLLQMLFVLTCADLAAVGPDVLNAWKLDLLTELYHSTRWRLASDSPSESPASLQLSERRTEVGALLRASGESNQTDPWWSEPLAALPSRYLLERTPEEAAGELVRLRSVTQRTATAWGRWNPERQAVEYVVGAHEDLAPGIFHRLTGALSSLRHRILAAEIHTLPNHLVLDRFFVRDLDFPNEPPATRLESISAALVESLTNPTHKVPKFRQVWGDSTQATARQLGKLPTRVEIDNNTSHRNTIISIVTYDGLCLLYTVSKCLFDLGVSVTFAKISTFVDQVVDVFYVTDGLGHKIFDEQHLQEIRRVLKHQVDAVHHLEA